MTMKPLTGYSEIGPFELETNNSLLQETGSLGCSWQDVVLVRRGPVLSGAETR